MQTASDRKASELVRGLGLWACTALIIGSTVGQAIFLVSNQVARDVGSLGWALASWLIGGTVERGNPRFPVLTERGAIRGRL